MNSFLFSKDQLSAINHIDGPIAIIADAGSGKTTTLLARAANIVKKKSLTSSEITILTFSSRTAAHMKKIAKETLFPDNLNQFIYLDTITTFHTFCLRFLKKNDQFLKAYGLSKKFSLADKSAMLFIIGKIKEKLKEDFDINDDLVLKYIDIMDKNSLPYRDINFRFLSNTLQSKISIDKKEWFSMSHLQEEDINTISKIYISYKKILRSNNLVDFNDLINLSIDILSKNKDVFKPKYILVDEVQDTNKQQQALLAELIDNNENICIAGDKKQSIFRWLGGEPSILNEFGKIIKSKVAVIELKNVFRSEEEISRYAKEIHKGKDFVVKSNIIKVSNLETPSEEAATVSSYIKKISEKGIQLSEIAILVKYKNIAINFEKDFIKKGIPYQNGESGTIFNKKIIKEYISFLNYIVNEKNEIGLEKWLTGTMKYITYKELQKLKSKGFTPQKIIFSEKDSLVKNILPKQKIKKIQKLKKAIVLLRDAVETTSNEEFVSLFNEHVGFIDEIQKRSYEAFEKKARDYYKECYSDIAAINSIMYEYSNIEDFVNNTSIDSYTSLDEKVNILTIHGAKGLEFTCVFIPHLNDGILPVFKASRNKEIMKDEKNLFYVAVTRAKKFLHLSSVKYTEKGEMEPSEFLKNIRCK